MELTREEILRRIEAHKARIRAFGVQRLTLFGSHARGEARADSDVDFLVEFAPGRGLFDDYCDLKELLEADLESEVDLVKRGLVREELREAILGGSQFDASLWLVPERHSGCLPQDRALRRRAVQKRVSRQAPFGWRVP